MNYKIAPSLICMDLMRVEEQLRVIEQYGDYLHVDIMDTRFVPTLGLFPGFVKSLRSASSLPIDCHLMVEEPLNYIGELSEMRVNTIIPHAEVLSRSGGFRILDAIRDGGCREGIAVNPCTPLEVIRPYIHRIKRLTIMTIEPGFPGAPFIPETVKKIGEASKIRKELDLDFEIEMDGSLCDSNLGMLKKAGCDVFVAGTAALFGRGENLEQNYLELRQQFECFSMQEKPHPEGEL